MTDSVEVPINDLLTFRPVDQVEWVTVPYLLKSDEGPRHRFEWEYKLILPDFLAAWDVWDYWEKARVHSMRQHLPQGDILWDVGAESGWCSVVYATMVGPENMVLIEPSAEMWPNIKHTWQHNHRKPPRACFAGLIGDRHTGQAVTGWPAESDGPLLEDRLYSYLHQNPGLPQLTIDGLADLIGPPDALTIDVEGAELVVLRSGQQTLTEHRPQVWVSVHPDLSEQDYGTTAAELTLWMFNLGYEMELLGQDHETHVRFFIK